MYPIVAVNSIPYREESTRFVWDVAAGSTPGVTAAGINEAFPLSGALALRHQQAGRRIVNSGICSQCRAAGDHQSLRGASGPVADGQVDQGVVALWVARHHFVGRCDTSDTAARANKSATCYTSRICSICSSANERLECWDATVYNVGGGGEMSVSLQELTTICRRVTGREVPITSVPDTNSSTFGFTSRIRRSAGEFGWRRRTVEQAVQDIHEWLCKHPEDASVLA